MTVVRRKYEITTGKLFRKRGATGSLAVLP